MRHTHSTEPLENLTHLALKSHVLTKHGSERAATTITTIFNSYEPEENNSFSIITQVINRAIAFSFILLVSSSETSRNRAAAILKISASVQTFLRRGRQPEVESSFPWRLLQFICLQRLIDLFSLVVTWFEMGKQQFKMADA